MDSNEKYLRWKAHKGLRERTKVIPEYLTRLEYELDIICSMQYADYFLVLSHILQAARKRNIVIGPGRGSAGGCLVAFTLYITDLDPLQHGLLMERFLNPARRSLPDVDIDVAESQRPLLLQLIRELYGEEHVAIIGTQGTIGAKAALKDANRVLGGTYSEGERYCSLLPKPKFGRAPTLADYSGPRDGVYNLACGLEGTIRNLGQHAAGVIISPDPLEDLTPLWHPANQDAWVTAFDMHELEELGFVKMDYLGLRNLDVIGNCLKQIGMDWEDLPTVPEECSDPKVYEMLSRGENKGVFQLDSNMMRGILMDMKPSTFGDISATIALGRPGPMGEGSHKEYAKRKRETDRGKHQEP